MDPSESTGKAVTREWLDTCETYRSPQARHGPRAEEDAGGPSAMTASDDAGSPSNLVMNPVGPRVSDLSASVAARPVCPVRKLPIPFTAVIKPDGTGDFSVIDPAKVQLCLDARLCGVCGSFIPYWIAFLGGPYSASDKGAYTDPGMHEECAEWAIRLCPYILRPRVPRRGGEQEPVNAVTMYGDKEQDGWVMQIARGYKVRPGYLKDGSHARLIIATGVARRRVFAYQGKALIEVGASA